jgi:hypothetical protein
MSEFLNISSASYLKTGLKVPKIHIKFKNVWSPVATNDARRQE